MGKVVLLGLLVTASCGRLGFEHEPNAPDAGAVPLVECGQPQRFQVGASTLKDMVAVPTKAGFAVITVDAAKEMRGWIFEWKMGALAPGPQNVAIESNITGAIGAASIGDKLLVAAIHGEATMGTLGTTFHPLDATLAWRSAPVGIGDRVIGAAPLALSGTADELAAIRFDAGDVAVHGIDMLGADMGTRMLGVTADVPSELGIVRASTSYAASWVATPGSPNTTKLALLDEYYAVVKGPITITGLMDTIRPRARWAPSSDVYAVTWFEKNAANGDDLYVQAFDAKLQPLFPAKLVANDAVRPQIATDGTDFFIAYRTIKTPETMAVAHVTPGGVITARTVGASGGSPAAYTLVERSGQPVLVYAETGGSGPDLWFDAMCP